MQRLVLAVTLSLVAALTPAQAKDPLELRDMGSFHIGGRLIEMIPERMPLDMAQHPYTQALLAAAPRIGQSIAATERQDADLVPALPVTGCPYRARCPAAFGRCDEIDPPLTPSAEGNLVACHLIIERSSGRER